MPAFYNTLTARKEPLTTLEPNHVRVYVCGPTVYDLSHLGHARCYTVYDILVRHLRASGLRVTYVRNITDVDDKIIKRAQETGESPIALAARFTAAFHDDMARLGNLQPDIEPKVSDHIDAVKTLIGVLIERGAAYSSEGDVYFAVESSSEYGKLSHRKLSEMEAGASGRVSSDEAQKKRNASDFALWKKAGPDELGWESPWGRGRPGWHVECSAMSMQHLGETLDIHGGGLDLVFPHHENEIAQSEAATGKPYSRLWVHNGFVEIDKQKMSKSLGNFFTAREVFRFVEPEAIRYFMLTVHYRAPLNLDWTLDDSGQVTGFPQIEEAERRVEYLYATCERLHAIPDERIDANSAETFAHGKSFSEAISRSLDDDLNTPVALAEINELLKETNELVDRALRKKGRASRRAIDACLREFDTLRQILGLGTEESTPVLERIRARRAASRGVSGEWVESRIAARVEARARRDFTAADAIRDELAARGIELMDGPRGTTWRIT